MDLAIGARDVFVMMTLFARDGTSKLVESCSYPLTGVACVSRVYTDQGVFEVSPDGLEARATYGATVAELRELTGLELLG